jgi:hypothetical protein
MLIRDRNVGAIPIVALDDFLGVAAAVLNPQIELGSADRAVPRNEVLFDRECAFRVRIDLDAAALIGVERDRVLADVARNRRRDQAGLRIVRQDVAADSRSGRIADRSSGCRCGLRFL